MAHNDERDEILVLITESVTDAALAWLKEHGGVPILIYEGQDWQPLADRIRAIIVRAFRVDKEVLDRLPALEIVVKHGTGVNTIDLDETTARGIKVTNTPGANANAVAEHSVALLSALSRDLMDSDPLVREGRFTERFELRQTKELTESRLGIVGAGRIGQRIAQICRGGYGCEIGFVDPYASAKVATSMGANMFADVDELFTWADNVVVAAPLTPETKMLIGASTLKLLGAEGSLVCARLGVRNIDEVSPCRGRQGARADLDDDHRRHRAIRRCSRPRSPSPQARSREHDGHPPLGRTPWFRGRAGGHPSFLCHVADRGRRWPRARLPGRSR